MELRKSNYLKPAEFLLVSCFNLGNFAALLTKDLLQPRIQVTAAPYGQFMQTLLRSDEEMWPSSLIGTIVWTMPDSISSGLRKMYAGEEVETTELLSDVDTFCASVRKIPAHIKFIFVPLWVVGPHEGRLGLLDLHLRRGISLALMRMNLKLAEAAQKDSRIVVFDTSRWVAVHGERSFSTRLWYMSKTVFTVDFFKVAVREVKAAYGALNGYSRKLLILDLDDTLWGGIVGDAGWQNLRLGGHDATGEAYVDFQRQLKSLRNRGVLLGIVSKNEEKVAREAIRSHPEMLLREEDFAGWRINWQDKAQNIAELVAELNLGLQSVVFIDDNPIERDRVRAALPEVLVPDWPASALDYKTTLLQLTCFDTPFISTEDRVRTEMYVSERKRAEEKTQIGSVEDWLKTLAISVTVDDLSPADLERATQLFNKTNQMNLSTRRLTQDGLWAWSRERQNRLLVFRVSDKHGDYGLVGIAGLELPDDPVQPARLTDFILSCRAMGRAVEETMLHVITKVAREKAAREIRAVYLPTEKNRPCLRFFESSGFIQLKEAYHFSLDSESSYIKPAAVNLLVHASGTQTLA